MAFKVCESDGYIIGIGKNQAETGGVTEEQYNRIAETLRNKPTDPGGFQYKLRADTLEWELVELPPAPDVEDEPTIEDKAEAYDILMGGASE